MGSGQSQFAALKLRSLALVPSSGALTRPCELHLWQLHCKTLPAAPRRSGQRLAAVPRPGFAGPYASGIDQNHRSTSTSGSAIKRSAFGWIIPARRRWRLPAHKQKAVTASSHLASTRSAFRSLRSLQFSLVPSKRQLAVLVRHPQPSRGGQSPGLRQLFEST